MNKIVDHSLQELCSINTALVVGAAFKLCLSGPGYDAVPTTTEIEKVRKRAGLSRHLWEVHGGRVLHLARQLQPVLPFHE